MGLLDLWDRGDRKALLGSLEHLEYVELMVSLDQRDPRVSPDQPVHEEIRDPLVHKVPGEIPVKEETSEVPVRPG